MNIRWDYFVNQYDTRYVATADGRENRHIQFVRECASVISVLQVDNLSVSFSCVGTYVGRFRIKPTVSSIFTRIFSGL
jgi:hypothetical protein